MTQSALKPACCALLLLASIVQGLQDVPVFHYKTKEVLVGQNTSLPCYLENIGSKIFISSTEWSKKDTTKLALYTKGYGYHYFVSNVTLQPIVNGTDTLMGTRLELANINKRDAGTYICDITSFPNGSLQRKTKLIVKDKIECDMNSTIEVNSGENVTINCSAISDVAYTWSKDEVTVSDKAALHLLSVSAASAGVYKLTANTGNNRLHATFTVTVFMQTTDYWTDSPDYQSSSGTSESTSHSPVTAFTTEDTHNSTPTTPDSFSPSTNTSASTTFTETQSEASESFNYYETYHTTTHYDHSESSDTVRTVSQPFNLSETVHTDTGETTRPSERYSTTEYAIINDTDSGLNKTRLPKAFTSTASDPHASLGTAVVNTGASPSSTTDVILQEDHQEPEGQSHLVLTLSIIGVVLLIIVALTLYRRRVIRKRMDLPPSFKPPPPPVKYAAVRNPQQQFPTDRCNSVTVGSRMQMRGTFV